MTDLTNATHGGGRLGARWAAWRRASANRRIFSDLLTVGGFTLLVKGIALGKELLVAYRFGRGDLLDAYLIALLLPTYAVNVLAGSFSSAFVPRYILVRNTVGPEAARALAASAFFVIVALLVAASGLLAVGAPAILPMLGSGFSPEKLAFTQRLFVLALPMIVAAGAASVLTALLHARESFSLPSAVPLLSSTLIIVTLAVTEGREATLAMAAMMSVGAVAEVVLLAEAARRAGVLVLPRWRGVSPNLRAVFEQYMPLFAAGAIATSTTLVDQAMAAALPAGSVSALSYGGKLPTAVMAVGSLALGTVVLPHFSRMIAAADWPTLWRTVRVYRNLILLVTGIGTLIACLLSTPLVRLLFLRGSFSAADVPLVSQLQILYFLQIPPFVVGIMGVRLLSAFSMNRLVMIISIGNVVVNAVGNIALMRIWGVRGIALSTVLVYTISSLLVWAAATRTLRSMAPQSNS